MDSWGALDRANSRPCVSSSHFADLNGLDSMPGGLVIGMPHLVSGNEKAALVDGLGIQNLMNDRLDKLGDACYSDITTTAPVRRGTQNLIERKLVTRRASAFSWASFRVRVDECQAVVVTVVDALPIIAITTRQQGSSLSSLQLATEEGLVCHVLPELRN